MRRAFLLLTAAVLAACATNDDAVKDSTAATASGDVALHSSDVAGTWEGSTMAEASDSVLSKWKTVSVTDSTSILLIEGVPDTIRTHIAYEGDSLIATSEPYMTPALPNVQITFRSVGRLANGTLKGTVIDRLASNPDSVVARYRWEASRPK